MLELGILIFSFIGNIYLAALVYKANPKSRTNQLFLAFISVTLLWLAANYYSYETSDSGRALIAIRAVMFLASLQVFLLFLFVHTFPEIGLRLKRYKLYIYSIYTLFVMALAFTPLIFSGLRSMDPVPNPIPGPAIPMFGLLALGSLLSIIYQLISKTRHAKGQLRQQLFYLSVGIIVTFSLIALSNFILVLIGNTTFLILTPFYTLILASTVAYTIIAHQLFDIRVIIRKTVEYSGLLGFTLLVYSMVIFFFSTTFGGASVFNIRNFVANLIAAMLIALGFDPIRRFLARTTDRYLFKGEYDQQAVLAALSQKLSDSVDLNEALQSLVSIIKSQLRLNHAAVITFTAEDKQVLIKNIAQDGFNDTSVLQLRPENALVLQFARQPQVLVTEFLRQQCKAQHISRDWRQVCEVLLVDLEKLGVAIAIPILVNGKAIGMFLVGEKLSGDIFSQNEIAFLSIVANQTANTIEKARFWEEDQMKSEFVSIASHELLTPTAAMKGYLSMILDDNMGQVDDTARRYLTKVAQSSDRLAQLVEELLNVSRIESGRLKINKRQFSMVESVTRAVDELQVNAKKKQLDVAFVDPMGNLPNVFADPDHVYRVLINLLGNAIKYTTSGWVRAFVTHYSPTHLLFAVSDSGLGIPKENQDKLFEKFYRAERKDIAGIQGTGLGLYISKKIIELMDGQMWFVSETGKGSTFYFTLPIYNPELHHEVIQPQPAVASAFTKA